MIYASYYMAGFEYICSTSTLPETQKTNFSYKVEAHEGNDATSNNKAKAVASVVISSNRDRATISSVASVLRIWLMLSTWIRRPLETFKASMKTGKT